MIRIRWSPSFVRSDFQRFYESSPSFHQNFKIRIRAKFPLFEEATADQIEIPPEISKLLGRPFETGPGRNYNFLSEDKIWVVNLTRDFLALTCRKYKQWELFSEQLELAISALCEEYRPSFLSRVGLRYRDVIRRSRLGLNETPWRQLLRSEIAGELGYEEFANNIKTLKTEIVFELPAATQARMLHGLAKTGTEEVYLIDTDFFSTDRTEVKDVWDRLGKFNQYARSIFRWCITDELHRAMGPKPIKQRGE